MCETALYIKVRATRARRRERHDSTGRSYRGNNGKPRSASGRRRGRGRVVSREPSAHSHTATPSLSSPSSSPRPHCGQGRGGKDEVSPQLAVGRCKREIQPCSCWGAPEGPWERGGRGGRRWGGGRKFFFLPFPISILIDHRFVCRTPGPISSSTSVPFPRRRRGSTIRWRHSV
jgi:hypothetical protein